MILLNFSGHPAPRGSEQMDVVDFPPVISNPTPAEINKKAQELASLACKNKKIQEAVLRGEYHILLPGYSPLAAALISELAGRTGRLPTVRWGMRRRDKYYLSPPCCLQATRTGAKAKRQVR